MGIAAAPALTDTERYVWVQPPLRGQLRRLARSRLRPAYSRPAGVRLQRPPDSSVPL